MEIEGSEIVEKGYGGGNPTRQPVGEEIQNAEILETSKDIRNASAEPVI